MNRETIEKDAHGASVEAYNSERVRGNNFALQAAQRAYWRRKFELLALYDYAPTETEVGLAALYGIRPHRPPE